MMNTFPYDIRTASTAELEAALERLKDLVGVLKSEIAGLEGEEYEPEQIARPEITSRSMLESEVQYFQRLVHCLTLEVSDLENAT